MSFVIIVSMDIKQPEMEMVHYIRKPKDKFVVTKYRPIRGILIGGKNG
jgi:hypothetical protein